MQCDLSTGWSVKPLEKVATLQRGFDLPVQEREEGKIPVYGSNGIDGWHSHAAVSGPGVLTGRSGTIGPVYFETRDYWPLNTTLYVRDFHGNEPRFVARMLESLDLKRFAASTGVPSLNRNFVHPTPVLLPPPDEQSRIAGVLDTVDEAIAKTEAVIAKLNQVRAGLLHDLLTSGVGEHGQLRDPIAHPEQFQDSPLGRIPHEWEIVFADDLCSQVVDCPHSTPTYVSDGIPCIRTADMLPGQLILNQAYRVTEETYREQTVRLVPQEGDIIYSREGERLGIASPVGPEPVCLGQRVMHLRPKPETDTDYLVWAMNAPAFYNQVVVRIGATTSPHINVGDIRKFVLLRPPSKEQGLIGQTLRAYDRLMRSEEALLAKYQLVKQGLLSDLLTGRVRVLASVSTVENQS
jgi:type I restriction enzyme, S subunit